MNRHGFLKSPAQGDHRNNQLDLKGFDGIPFPERSIRDLASSMDLPALFPHWNANCPLHRLYAEKAAWRFEMEMSVAEQSAFRNTADTLSQFLSIFPLGVMGTLPGATEPVPGAAGNLPAGLSIAPSAFAALAATGVLQQLSFSGFPSLLPLAASCRPAAGRSGMRTYFEAMVHRRFTMHPVGAKFRYGRPDLRVPEFCFICPITADNSPAPLRRANTAPDSCVDPIDGFFPKPGIQPCIVDRERRPQPRPPWNGGASSGPGNPPQGTLIQEKAPL